MHGVLPVVPIVADMLEFLVTKSTVELIDGLARE